MRIVRANDEGHTLYRITGALVGPTPFLAETMLVVALNEANAKAAYAQALGYVPEAVQVEDRGSADRTEIALWQDVSRA